MVLLLAPFTRGWASRLHTDEEPWASQSSLFSFPPSPAGILKLYTTASWRWRQVRTYGHSNLRWWPWTMHARLQAPLPAYTTHSMQKLNLRTSIVPLQGRRISHSSAKENYCDVLLCDGWCGLTLGPKICLAGNIATHTPHRGVCYGGWPKQGWGHPPLAFEHTGILNSASKRTYIQHLHAQN